MNKSLVYKYRYLFAIGISVLTYVLLDKYHDNRVIKMGLWAIFAALLFLMALLVFYVIPAEINAFKTNLKCDINAVSGSIQNVASRFEDVKDNLTDAGTNFEDVKDNVMDVVSDFKDDVRGAVSNLRDEEFY